jgi:hypothetical protein
VCTHTHTHSCICMHAWMQVRLNDSTVNPMRRRRGVGIQRASHRQLWPTSYRACAHAHGESGQSAQPILVQKWTPALELCNSDERALGANLSHDLTGCEHGRHDPCALLPAPGGCLLNASHSSVCGVLVALRNASHAREMLHMRARRSAFTRYHVLHRTSTHTLNPNH